MIFYEGELGNSIFLVYQGEFSIEKSIKNSVKRKNETIVTVNRGTILGLEILFGYKSYINTIRALGNNNSIFKINLEEIEKFRDKIKYSFKNIFKQQKVILRENYVKHLANADNANVTFRSLVKGSYKNKIDEALEINDKVKKEAKTVLIEMSEKPEEKTNDSNLDLKGFKVSQRFIDRQILKSIYSLENINISNNYNSNRNINQLENDENTKIENFQNLENNNTKRCKSANYRTFEKKNTFKFYKESIDFNCNNEFLNNYNFDLNKHANYPSNNFDYKQTFLSELRINKNVSNFQSVFTVADKLKNENFYTKYMNKINNVLNSTMNKLKENTSINTTFNNANLINLDNTNMNKSYLIKNNIRSINCPESNINVNNKNYSTNIKKAVILNCRENSNSSINKLVSNNNLNEQEFYSTNIEIPSNKLSNISLKMLKNLRKMRSLSQSLNNVNISNNLNSINEKISPDKNKLTESIKFNDHWNIVKIPNQRDMILEARKKRKNKILFDNYELRYLDKVKKKEEIEKKKELKKKQLRKELLYEGNIIANFPKNEEQSYKSGKFNIPLVIMGN